jgi:MFS family permease
MLGVFVSGLMQAPMGFMADRVNRKAMVITGGLITGFALLSFEWASGFWDLFLANILFGIGGGISMPALMALVVLKGNRTDAMGSVMGLMTMAHSTGMLAGAVLAGAMMDMFQLRQAFSMGAIFMILSLLVFFCVHIPQ